MAQVCNYLLKTLGFALTLRSNLGFLTWLGSVTTAALVYLFSTPVAGQALPSALTISGVLAAIFLSEHIYFATRYIVRVALSKLDSPGLIKERQERFIVRRRFLQESLGVEKDAEFHGPGVGSGIGIEEDAEFWGRQQGAKAAIDVGKNIIRNAGRIKKNQ
jgi:anoctamin-10